MKTKNFLFSSIGLLFFSISLFAQEYIPPNSEKDNVKSITKQELLDAKNVEALLNDFPKSDFTITSFKLTIVEKEKKNIYEFDALGNLLSSLMTERIKATSAKTMIYFEYIKGKVKNRNEAPFRSFPPATFIINEK